MKVGELTLEEINRFIPLLEPSEFLYKKECGVLEIPRESVMNLNEWKILGLHAAPASTRREFYCMFERLKDRKQAWCQVPYTYVEKYVWTLPKLP
jgi:hypothetical protein